MFFMKLAATFTLIMVLSWFCENILSVRYRKLFGHISVILFFLAVLSLTANIWF